MSIISQKQIYLSSKDATHLVNNQTSDCRWFFKDIIKCPNQNTEIMMEVVNAQIPLSYYIVNSNNNTLKYTVNSVSQTDITITPGNYNINDLTGELSTSLGSDFTITYSDITNKITFTHDSHDFQFLSTSTCFTLLGFSNSTHSSTSRTLTSDIQVDLSGISEIYVHSGFSTNNFDSRFLGYSQIICAIPVNIRSGGILQYFNLNNFSTSITEHVISNIHLELKDTDDKLIDLNGIHWSINLQVSFRYKTIYKAPINGIDNKKIQPIPDKSRIRLTEDERQRILIDDLSRFEKAKKKQEEASEKIKKK